MVRSAAWLEHVCGTEVVALGRAPGAQEDCALELVGRALSVRVTLHRGCIFVHVGGLDEPGPAEMLFSMGDAPEAWATVRRFVQALERSGVRSLQPRPVRLGTAGSADSWIIA